MGDDQHRRRRHGQCDRAYLGCDLRPRLLRRPQRARRHRAVQWRLEPEHHRRYLCAQRDHQLHGRRRHRLGLHADRRRPGGFHRQLRRREQLHGQGHAEHRTQDRPCRMSGEREAAVTEFPARSIAIAAYRALLHGLGRFVWLGGAWMTCVLACLVVDLLPWPTALFRLLVLLTVLVSAVASAAVSVSWFRALLLDETYYGAMPMKFGARQFRYLVYQSVIAGILAAPIASLCLIVRANSWWAAAYSFALGGPLEGTALCLLAGSILAAM